jgi:hypothetical protein
LCVIKVEPYFLCKQRIVLGGHFGQKLGVILYHTPVGTIGGGVQWWVPPLFEHTSRSVEKFNPCLALQVRPFAQRVPHFFSLRRRRLMTNNENSVFLNLVWLAKCQKQQ